MDFKLLADIARTNKKQLIIVLKIELKIFIPENIYDEKKS